jgi:GR25 family glycosyltransferase involved in LPS biosynthesis
VNPLWQAGLGTRLGERLAFVARRAGRRRSSAFSADDGPSVARVYVINLDRRADRWRGIRQELARVRDGQGSPLTAVTRRHRAVDWRDQGPTSGALDVAAEYTLAEQLFVQPVAVLHGDEDAAGIRIQMTAQEVAVARSHVEVWRRVAQGPDEYALVLEDDAYFTRRFVPATDALWRVLSAPAEGPPFDVLLLSFAEVDGGARKADVSRTHFRPVRGLWQLSGYVLSRRGAQRLLRRLPVRGPVDLWVNHQFAGLDVVAARHPVIRQRPAGASSNSYSVVPVLTALGVLTENRASRAPRPTSAAPVFASGSPDSGLRALATALSMLGYRCCSGVDVLPPEEHARVLAGGHGRVFDAYVDVTTLPPETWPALARAHPRARFIQTVPSGQDGRMDAPAAGPPRLVLPDGHEDKWQALADHLGCDYPAHAFPRVADRPQRLRVADAEPTAALSRALRWDRSPWIIPDRTWTGFSPRAEEWPTAESVLGLSDGQGGLDERRWRLRDDTFPGNLCLFRPDNARVLDGHAEIELRAETTPVREFTSGAIACTSRQTYGRYAAVIRPSAVSGVVTGMFLHRDAPRQEIDIEFLGSDPTRMLVNVYYNPGLEGTRLQHGYRGTPVLVDLGFDASADYHQYEIEWRPDTITWLADGRVVHRRRTWSPTPVPDLPAEFNLNLWHPRSVELAGTMNASALPAVAAFTDVVLEH